MRASRSASPPIPYTRRRRPWRLALRSARGSARRAGSAPRGRPPSSACRFPDRRTCGDVPGDSVEASPAEAGRGDVRGRPEIPWRPSPAEAGRGDAAATTWIFCGGGDGRRRLRDDETSARAPYQKSKISDTTSAPGPSPARREALAMGCCIARAAPKSDGRVRESALAREAPRRRTRATHSRRQRSVYAPRQRCCAAASCTAVSLLALPQVRPLRLRSFSSERHERSRRIFERCRRARDS